MPGDGRLIYDEPTGRLVYHTQTGQFAGTDRLLYKAPVATRIVGTAALPRETTFRHRVSSLSLPHGYVAQASVVQADADAVYPPATTAFARYSTNNAWSATASYSMASNNANLSFAIGLLFFRHPLASQWYQYLGDLPKPYRVSVASVAPRIRLYIPTVRNHPFSGITVCQAYTNPVVDYDAGTGTVDDIWGPAARELTTLPESPDMEMLFDTLAGDTTAVGNIDFTPLGELDMRVTGVDGNGNVPEVVRNLAVRTWFSSIPVGDGVYGASDGIGSREFQVYMDGTTAEIVLCVAGDQRACIDRYASAYQLT